MKENLLKIINYYGIPNQLRKFNEESFEFMEATIDYENHFGSLEHVVEEIADALVMLMQFIEYYKIQEDDIKKIMKQKIHRQLERMNES